MTSAAPTAWPVRAPVRVGLLAVLLLVAGFGGWSTLATITGAVIAPGRIGVESNRQVVQHPEGGVVAAVKVAEGDRVRAGQVVLRLDRSDLASRLAIAENRLFEVMARRGRLEAERDERAGIAFDPLLRATAETDPRVAELMAGQRRLLAARSDSVTREVAQLGKRRAQIASQIAGIRAQQAALDRQRELVARELEAQQSLFDRGLVPAARVLALQREAARLAGQSGELTAAAAQARARITEADIEIVKIGARRREEAITELRDIRLREADLAEDRRALLERLERRDIRAPVAGVVYGLAVFSPRAVVQPGAPLLYVMPQDRPVIIAARIDPLDVDKVFPGQPVRLGLPALDRRHTPSLAGRVRQVSADAFEDDRSNRRYYRAQIVLGRGELARLPAGVRLVPGMPVEVFLRTAERTPLAYLLKPLSDYFARAMR